MQLTSDDFLTALAYSRSIAVEVTTIDRYGDELPLPVLEGSVTLDKSAATRGALTLTLPPDTPIPDVSSDLLAPYGTEVRVRAGVSYLDGTTDLVPLGIFRVDETSASDTGATLGVSLNALDRSSILIDAVFEEDGFVAAGSNIGSVIALLIADGYPTVQFSDQYAATSVTTPLLSYEAGGDRWDFVLGLAEAANCDLFFDGNGELVLHGRAVKADADYEIAEGEGGTLLGITKGWGREDAVNRVVVNGESSGEDPVRGEARDDDPFSPTRYGGPFGKVTYTYSSEFVTTEDQANAVASRILEQLKGTSQSISLEALPNPALEPGDVIRVRRERMGVDELHTIDRVEVPLIGASMRVDTRLTAVQW